MGSRTTTDLMTVTAAGSMTSKMMAILSVYEGFPCHDFAIEFEGEVEIIKHQNNLVDFHSGSFKLCILFKGFQVTDYKITTTKQAELP